MRIREIILEAIAVVCIFMTGYSLLLIGYGFGG